MHEVREFHSALPGRRFQSPPKKAFSFDELPREQAGIEGAPCDPQPASLGERVAVYLLLSLFCYLCWDGVIRLAQWATGAQ